MLDEDKELNADELTELALLSLLDDDAELGKEELSDAELRLLDTTELVESDTLLDETVTPPELETL